MIKAAIAGASGYTGIELVNLILNHSEAELCAITSSSSKGSSLTEIFPAMAGFENLIFQDLEKAVHSQKLDVIFLALPHKISMKYVPALLEKNIKVIDLSADFRFTDPAAYESAYQQHTSKHLLQDSVYGLSEIYRDKIQTSNLIGNPGCYPTSILLPLLPLLQQELILPDTIICDSKSGVSGAGRSPGPSTHFCQVNESFNPYKIGSHRHTPEINEILSIHSQKKVAVTFVPHLLPLTRGMLSTIYVKTHQETTRTAIQKTYDTWYGEEPFVRILGKDDYPAISHVKGTNRCDIGFYFDENSRQIIIISAIDNLLKGAAGQAVQNMNIMFKLPNDIGLNWICTSL